MDKHVGESSFAERGTCGKACGRTEETPQHRFHYQCSSRKSSSASKAGISCKRSLSPCQSSSARHVPKPDSSTTRAFAHFLSSPQLAGVPILRMPLQKPATLTKPKPATSRRL